MTASAVNGYLVVRWQRDYRGLDRDPFEVVADAFYQKALPLPIAEVYERAARGYGCWTPVCSTRPEAELLLDYTVRNYTAVSGVELIAVWSPYLSAHGAPFQLEPKMRCLGFDVIGVGEWSLLGALISAGLARAKLGTHLNEFGLLDDPERADLVRRVHDEAVREERVEELSADPRLPREVVGIFVDEP